MQKDVIYIDVEDDITAIIGKVKASKHPIVALVPPKRIGAIQSAVNLKLVHRAAEQVDKQLVVISNNAGLVALASSAGIPVAKNLQSKPELADIPVLEIDDGDDIIDGAEVAPREKTSKNAEELPELDDAAAGAEADADVPKRAGTKKAKLASLGEQKTKPTTLSATAAGKGKASIPNFERFRKKLFIGLAAFFVLGGFLIWAMFFAPHAKIIITARTADFALNSGVAFGQDLATDLKAGTLKAEYKSAKKDVSLPVTATGQKDIGTKATGQVKFSTRDTDYIGTVIPAGTQLATESGATYTTDESVEISLTSFVRPNFVASVSITAVANGTNYNGAVGAMTGAPSGISASVSQTTSGGTDKTMAIVQQSDVDKVSGDILKSGEADAAKADLKKQFGDGYIVLDSAFTSDSTGVKSSPAVGAEATDGKGTLAGSIIFSMVAIPKTEVGHYLDAYFAQRVDGKSDQKVYSNGRDSVSFTNISAKDNVFTANISTNGKIGPRINETALKDFAKGKNFGEIQSHVAAIGGVDNVDVKFSPFWVSVAPNDVKRITVEFKVDGA